MECGVFFGARIEEVRHNIRVRKERGSKLISSTNMTTIPEFLIRRFKQLGVDEGFGIVGDFALKLFDRLSHSCETKPCRVDPNINNLGLWLEGESTGLKLDLVDKDEFPTGGKLLRLETR